MALVGLPIEHRSPVEHDDERAFRLRREPEPVGPRDPQKALIRGYPLVFGLGFAGYYGQLGPAMVWNLLYPSIKLRLAVGILPSVFVGLQWQPEVQYRDTRKKEAFALTSTLLGVGTWYPWMQRLGVYVRGGAGWTHLTYFTQKARPAPGVQTTTVTAVMFQAFMHSLFNSNESSSSRSQSVLLSRTDASREEDQGPKERPNRVKFGLSDGHGGALMAAVGYEILNPRGLRIGLECQWTSTFLVGYHFGRVSLGLWLSWY